MTVVYVDSVFVLNTLVDYLLLFSAARLAGARLSRIRFLLAAALGGAYAVAVFLPGLGWLSLPPGKIAAGLLMALAAFGGQPRFPRLFLLLGAVSCGFAGCVLALGLVSGGGTAMENGVFYTDVDGKVLLISATAAYLVLTVVFRAGAKRCGGGGLLAPVTVSLLGRSVSMTALCDTGNTLQDPATGRTVLVAYAQRMQPLFPAALRPFLTPEALRNPALALERLARSGESAVRFRLLSYSAVGVESGLLLAVRTDRVVVNGRTYTNLLTALSPTAVGDRCAALWGGWETETGRGANRTWRRGDLYAAFSGKAPAASSASGPAAGDAGPLYGGERCAAAAAAPPAGDGAAGPHPGGERPSGADRT